MNSEFLGFEYPQQNWSKLPHQLVEGLPEIETMGELKVILYILRHTWGFQEFSGEGKKITFDEFQHGRKRKDGSRIDRGTGLGNSAVLKGIQNALAHGFIEVEKDESDKGRVKCYYKLKMQESPETETEHPETGVVGTDSGGRTEKDTLEINLKKESDQPQIAPIRPESSEKQNNLIPKVKKTIPYENQTPQQRMVGAWCTITNSSTALCAQKFLRASQELLADGYTDKDLLNCYGSGSTWWNVIRPWQAKDGNLPDIRSVKDTIKIATEWTARERARMAQ